MRLRLEAANELSSQWALPNQELAARIEVLRRILRRTRAADDGEDSQLGSCGDRANQAPWLPPVHLTSRRPFQGRLLLSLGYTSDAWQRLESDLRLQHLTQETELRETTAYGQKYEIRATLMGPAGIPADVVSVWIVLKDEEVPRFITAYPGGDR